MSVAEGEKRPAKATKVDYALVLKRLEKRVLEESEHTTVLRVLSRRALWEQLPPDGILRCAKLAQAASDVELSLTILGWLTENYPDFTDAWKERVVLLELMGRTRVEAEKSDPESATQGVGHEPAPWDEAQQPGFTPAPQDDLVDESLIEEPFLELRRREEALNLYLDLFRAREDCFARQWVDKSKGTQGYVPVRRPMESADLLEHFQGRRTYGIYLLRRDSRVCLGVLDADLDGRLRAGKLSGEKRDLLRREQRYLLTRLPELGREKGLPCLVEFSGGKGFHFWFFLREPVPAAKVRALLQVLARCIQPDLSCFRLEVFPKQDRLEGKGLGNLVKLPLGVHRMTGKLSYFIHVRDRSWQAQVEALKKVQRIAPEVFDRPQGASEKGEILVHPRHRKWAEEYPELAILEERCVALGQILVDCRNSRSLRLRDEKILFGTIGFLPRAKSLIHHVFRELPEYNVHAVDYQLSRLRGTPLGCRKIHRLLGLTGEFCRFPESARYAHPLLHCPQWSEPPAPKAERVENLRDAIDSLKCAIHTVERFLVHPGTESAARDGQQDEH